MEPNKTEKDFKQKLEQRTIQPSDMAWDRLDAMLSVAENKKPKKNKAWMYIAACFLVFLVLGALFLKQEKQSNGLENNTNGVVIKDNEPQNENTQSPLDNTRMIAPVMQQESVAASGNTPKVVRASGTHINKEVPSEKAFQGQTQEQIALADTKDQQNGIQQNDADQLLASVSGSTAKKRATVKVDPNSLLSSVEGELTESYRSKAFQGVIKSFNTVKVAVANRNQE